MPPTLTLGSLFDGIGGFPLAGIRNGINPVWASEIEAFPIKVTKKWFPDMIHAGDITRLKGADLIPVDLISGGSPCQDLSISGTRSGLNGERSGLFMEQIRIVKEMRCADERRGRTAESIRPRFMAWENVPGAFSSGNYEDFRAVLQETGRIADNGLSVPRPPSGRWESAGTILGDKFSIAWRVLDSQYWGVPQRRKRIFLIADFGGQSAPKILFEQESLPGYFKTSGGAGENASGTASTSTGSTSSGIDDPVLCLNDQGGSFMAVSYNHTGTLRAQMAGNIPIVMGEPVQLFENHGIDSRYNGPLKVAPTVAARYGTGGNNVPLVAQKHPEVYCIAGNIIDREVKNGGNGLGYQPNISYTLNTVDRHAVLASGKSATGTLLASCGDKKWLGNQEAFSGDFNVIQKKMLRRLTILECERLMGFPDHWTDVANSSDSARYKALGNSVAIPCVEYIMRGIAMAYN